ncbi:putative metallophosphoesterase YkoQ [Alicyclobacillus acidoterrestris]|uniref:metallophosphoesterase n=1 Tax=Alicyclobacillus suci TaxID=2816080 RepID=UPI0011911BF9|nr:metallophosphoesterase [Alicyclobacillus suci]GEO25020.1 putative metallophosphoesterase YkoQ [Alicyclobacillus acidoterrestris]
MDWILLFVCLAAVLFYLTFVLPTQWLKIERIRLPLHAGLKIIQISDLHVERNRIRPEKIRRVIEAERPDFLCLTGDFLDKPTSFMLLTPFLKMIQSTSVPAYAVLGNHDYKLERPEELIRLLEAFGIRVLVNEAAELQEVYLVGVDDFDSQHSDVDASFQFVTPRKPVIVMTHDPTITLFMERRYDYLFAGHLHGKQFNLPFFFKVKDMGPLARSGVYKGLHTMPHGMLYISKGVGQSGYNFRFLVRSEITVHEL